MKKIIRFSGFLVCCALPFSVQGFDIPWSTVDGGGSLSSGGVYTLAGTIGQPDASLSTGGNFTLTGGFWGGAYQGAAPQLSVMLSGNNVVLCRPSWATGYVLLSSESLSPIAWDIVPKTPVLVGNQFCVTIPLAELPKSNFYELWLP